MSDDEAEHKMSDDEEEDPDMAKRPTVTIRINAHVNGEGRFNLFL